MARPRQAHEEAVRTLEEDIVFGRLAPGCRLVEDEVMARFALTRHAARQVLLALERIGALERRRNAGAQVRAFAPREVRELFDLRALLEGHAAALIPLPVDAQQLAPLVATQQAHDRAVADDDLRAVLRTNQAFHRQLFALAGNAALEAAIADHARRAHPIRFASLGLAHYRERARQEHWAMIAALREGRREALIELCRRHLLPSRDAYLAATGPLAGRAA